MRDPLDLFQRASSRHTQTTIPGAMRMAYNGSTVVATCIGEETLGIHAVPLASFLQNDNNNNGDFGTLLGDILNKLAFLHDEGITVGAELLDPNEILIVRSTEGPQAILKFRRGVSPNKVEDIRSAGRVLNFIWTSRSRVPDTLVEDLISKMTAENTTMNASEARVHFALWTNSKRMRFLMDVSEILELKQNQHLEAVEKDGWLVINDSWILTLAPVLREKVERDSRKRRSYSPTSVVDLLRFARNMAHHYHPLAPEVRSALGPFENLGNFWVATFPLLLPHLHQAMKKFRGDTNCLRIRRFYSE